MNGSAIDQLTETWIGNRQNRGSSPWGLDSDREIPSKSGNTKDKQGYIFYKSTMKLCCGQYGTAIKPEQFYEHWVLVAKK